MQPMATQLGAEHEGGSHHDAATTSISFNQGRPSGPRSDALVVVRNAVAVSACRRVVDVVSSLASAAEPGRQGSGYKKTCLLGYLDHPAIVDVVGVMRRALLDPVAFDAWWITYPVGSHVPEHTDPAGVDGLCHVRANLVVVRGRGGDFIADGETIDLDVGDLVVFRPDIVRHAVTVVDEPRALLSLGTWWEATSMQAVWRA
jgi:hypothetical protein